MEGQHLFNKPTTFLHFTLSKTPDHREGEEHVRGRMKKGLINSENPLPTCLHRPKTGLHTGVDCPDFKEAGTP